MDDDDDDVVGVGGEKEYDDVTAFELLCCSCSSFTLYH